MKPPPLKRSLAFKAYEIEELADVYFFRPLGAVVARLAYSTPVSPNQLTVFSMVLGVAGGVLLGFPGLGLWGFAVLIVHSIIDSADGQLARLRNTVTAEGRVLDGVAGYLTFTAIHLGVFCNYSQSHPLPGVLLMVVPTLLAGISSSLQASMYDYYRNQYIRYGIKGEVCEPEDAGPKKDMGWFLSAASRGYDARQRRLAGSHVRVEEDLRRKFGEARLPPEVSSAYREANYWMVRGWNVFGDNTRFYAIGLFAWMGHLEYFFYFNIVPMNVVFALMMYLQARVDRKYLERLPSLCEDGAPRPCQ